MSDRIFKKTQRLYTLRYRTHLQTQQILSLTTDVEFDRTIQSILVIKNLSKRITTWRENTKTTNGPKKYKKENYILLDKVPIDDLSKCIPDCRVWHGCTNLSNCPLPKLHNIRQSWNYSRVRKKIASRHSIYTPKIR